MSYALTAEQRRVTCVHEAAHAVVHAIGGTFVYRVAVAPVGSTDGIEDETLGVCEHSGLGLAGGFLRYTPGEEYGADRARFRRTLRALPDAFRRDAYRRIRAYVCAVLAGKAAEDLLRGEEPYVDEASFCDAQPDDATIAEMAAWLLPYRRELDRLHEVTVETLRQPDVWARVLALADELEAAGDLDDDRLDRHLPQPLRNWPRPPARRVLTQ